MAYTAKWITPLAKAAGRSAAGLYYIFNKEKYKSPYTSELRGWTILRARGLECKGYVPTEDAVGKPVPPLLTKRGITANREGNGEVPPEKKDMRGSWADKLLLTRLSKLLPGGANKKNKSRIAYLLKKAGHTKIRTMDEAVALEVMKANDISIEGFEYANEPGTPGSSILVAPPAGTLSELRAQYVEMGERLKRAVDALVAKEKEYAEADALLERVRRGLMGYETEYKKAVKEDRFPVLHNPLGWPIEYLNWIRDR